VVNKEQSIQLRTLIGFGTSRIEYMAVFKRGAYI
jgi:hypothetical protein